VRQHSLAKARRRKCFEKAFRLLSPGEGTSEAKLAQSEAAVYKWDNVTLRERLLFTCIRGGAYELGWPGLSDRSRRLQKSRLEFVKQRGPDSGLHCPEGAPKRRGNMPDSIAFGLKDVGVEHRLPVDPFR
jgi:hypothetical protein